LAGVYQVTVQKEGFRDTVEQIKLSADRDAEIDIALPSDLRGETLASHRKNAAESTHRFNRPHPGIPAAPGKQTGVTD